MIIDGIGAPIGATAFPRQGRTTSSEITTGLLLLTGVVMSWPADCATCRTPTEPLLLLLLLLLRPLTFSK